MKININHLSPKAQDHIHDGFVTGIEVYGDFLTPTEIVNALICEHRLLMEKLDPILNPVVHTQNDDHMRHETEDSKPTFHASIRAAWNEVANRCIRFARPRTT